MKAANTVGLNATGSAPAAAIRCRTADCETASRTAALSFAITGPAVPAGEEGGAATLGGERDRLPMAPGVDQLRDPQRLRFGGVRRAQQGAAS